ncbi:MAG: tetratricopeptide repeat protein [Pseudomonadota bacterium]
MASTFVWLACAAAFASTAAPLLAKPAPIDDEIVCALVPDHAYDAAESGNVEAQAAIGAFLVDGPCGGDRPAVLEGVRWLEKASDLGHAKAALRLGAMYDFGEGISSDPDRAALHYGRAANAGMMEAQHRYGMILVSGGDAAKQAEGLFWLGAAANQGDSLAAAAVGLMHARGLHGIVRDGCLALLWFDASEEMGVPMSLEGLRGEVYANGDFEC